MKNLFDQLFLPSLIVFIIINNSNIKCFFFGIKWDSYYSNINQIIIKLKIEYIRFEWQ